AEAAERRAAFLAEAERLLASSLDFETTLSTLAALAVPDLADWCSVDVLEVDGSIRRIAVAHADPMKADLARKVRGYPADPPGRRSRWTTRGSTVRRRRRSRSPSAPIAPRTSFSPPSRTSSARRCRPCSCGHGSWPAARSTRGRRRAPST